MNTKEYISSGIIESYILGLASPEEAGIFECVIKNNAEVKEAFMETQKMFEELATIQAIEPPVDLKSKIWEQIQEKETQTPIEKNVLTETEKTEVLVEKPIYKITKNNSWKKYAAAASILFLLSVSSNIYWINSQKNTNAEIANLQSNISEQNLALQKADQKWKMIADPNMQAVALNGVGKHPDVKAVVFWDKTSKQVYLNAANLPKAPEGMQYQLWAIADGKPISAGLYTPEKDSETPLAVIASAQNFAITLEKTGGSEQPTMENMYVIGGV